MSNTSQKHVVTEIDKTARPVVYICSCGVRLPPSEMGEHQRTVGGKP